MNKNKRVFITDKKTGIIYNVMPYQIKLFGLIPNRYTHLGDWKKAKNPK